MTLKPVRGTFERVITEEHCDDSTVYPHTYTAIRGKKPQEARIYEKYFAVYKVGERSWQHWRLDHVPTGLHMATGKKLKDCIVKIEELLKLDLPWSEPDPEKWTVKYNTDSSAHVAYREALKTVAPYEPRPEPKPKEPAAYGTMASALEYHNTYCPYACAYRTLWEQDHFHKITKAKIHYQIRFNLVEELVNGYPSAQEAYEDIMLEPAGTVRFLMMGHPLNARARKSLMRWAVAHKLITIEVPA